MKITPFTYHIIYIILWLAGTVIMYSRHRKWMNTEEHGTNTTHDPTIGEIMFSVFIALIFWWFIVIWMIFELPFWDQSWADFKQSFKR